MKFWIHLICGKKSQFPASVDPNNPERPCQQCGLLMGGWGSGVNGPINALWLHLVCGRTSTFPAGIDPNEFGYPCQKCGHSGGRWIPA